MEHYYYAWRNQGALIARLFLYAFPAYAVGVAASFVLTYVLSELFNRQFIEDTPETLFRLVACPAVAIVLTWIFTTAPKRYRIHFYLNGCCAIHENDRTPDIYDWRDFTELSRERHPDYENGEVFRLRFVKRNGDHVPLPMAYGASGTAKMHTPILDAFLAAKTAMQGTKTGIDLNDPDAIADELGV